ncbi:MAG: ribonuclease HII [Clostridia bacterium]|nr:ribonuclease HII [Clostridia bacterium]
MPDFTFEAQATTQGYKAVCGVDEAGRGPLAGPVCAAAVILPQDVDIPELNDSKKLSAKKREAIFSVICEKAISYCIAYASVEEIDEHNILQATFMAMNRAIDGLEVQPDYALIDGNRTPTNIKVPCETIIGGDAKSCSIAAASILAKVSRDRLMEEYDKKYPEYQLTKHKGYGTKLHTELIKQYGPSRIHRMSFLGNILKDKI